MSAWLEISCKCGHVDDYDAFTSTPVSGQLPRLHFQCPKCNRSWRVEKKGQARIICGEILVPPDREVVEQEAVL